MFRLTHAADQAPDLHAVFQELAEEVQELLQGASLYLVGMMGR